MTGAMYNNYADIWMVAPTGFSIYNAHLHGVIENPMGAVETFAMLYNTQSVGAAVTFEETGLPAATNWSVWCTSLGSSNTSAVTFGLPNGTYNYTVRPLAGWVAQPTSGSVIVAGTSVVVRISFSHVPAGSFPVTFSESGLPIGTNWSATVGGVTSLASGSIITFVEPDGSYSFSVGTGARFVPSPPSGTIQVDGVPVEVVVTFTPVPAGDQVVTFEETGLPVGTTWSVDLSQSYGTESGPSIVFVLPSGAYPFTIPSPPGFRASPASGSFQVSGTAVSVSVTFSSSSGGGGSFLGLPGIDGYLLLGGIAAVAVVAALVVILSRRRARQGSGPPSVRPGEPPLRL